MALNSRPMWSTSGSFFLGAGLGAGSDSTAAAHRGGRRARRGAAAGEGGGGAGRLAGGAPLWLGGLLSLLVALPGCLAELITRNCSACGPGTRSPGRAFNAWRRGLRTRACRRTQRPHGRLPCWVAHLPGGRGTAPTPGEPVCWCGRGRATGQGLRTASAWCPRPGAAGGRTGPGGARRGSGRRGA